MELLDDNKSPFPVHRKFLLPYYRHWRDAGLAAPSAKRKAALAAARAGNLEKAVALDPDCAGWRLLAGRAAADLGDAALAVEHFDAAAAAHPEAVIGFAYLLGKDRPKSALGDIDGMDPGVRRALEARVDRAWWAGPLLASHYGAAASPAKRRELARHFDGALLACPKTAWLYAQRGRLMQYEEPETADADLAKAARLDAERGWLHAWRGQFLLHLGRTRPGLEALERGVRRDPAYPLGLIWLAGARLRAGNEKGSLALLDRYFALGEEHSHAYQLRSVLRRRSGDWKGAVLDVSRAVLEWPEKEQRFVERGAPAAALVDAEKALGRLSAASPGEPVLRLWRGECLLRLGRFVDAGKELSVFLKAAGRDAGKLEPLARWARVWKERSTGRS